MRTANGLSDGRFLRFVILAALFAAIVAVALSERAGAQDTNKGAAQGQITFTKDVAPILQRSCQTCHRPNSIAPMSLLTYGEVRPWAQAIKLNVAQRVMPPWHNDPNVGIHDFKNSLALSDDDIATIVRWVDGGAPQGNPADMPPARHFDDSDTWAIGTPDLVVQMPVDFMVPARGPDAWPNIAPIPTGLTEDRYIKALQTKPLKGLNVVHHAGATIIAPDGTTSSATVYGIGKNADLYEEGTGILMKAGSKISWSLHIHPNGKEMPANVAIAFKFYPKGYVPGHVVHTVEMGDNTDLDFPPNTDNIRFDGYQTLFKPTRILGWQPHMHTRGKAMCIEAIFPTPDGAAVGGAGRGDRVQTLSCVNKFEFNWMINYEYATDAQPLLPAGTVIHVISWHDNSAASKTNPDPDNWIGYGQRTVDDMSHAWVTYETLSDEEFKQAVEERKAKKENLSSKATNQPDDRPAAARQ